MKSKKHIRIWHVGNWCVHTGQKYVESPFQSPSKGVEILNYAKPFIDALKKIKGAEVISEPSWELYSMSPELFTARLKWASIIVFADVETKCMMLHPDFFTRGKWGDKPVTFPDRFDILKAWVKKGGHFHMNGGWYSFTGELGKGGWGRSRMHEALPVVCLPNDDLIESTAGYEVRCNFPSSPIVKGINWNSIPPLLGFNEAQLREGAISLVDINNQNEWHPLLASMKFGKGRTSAWMTGASPHWGINFMKWSEYDKLWKQLFTSPY